MAHFDSPDQLPARYREQIAAQDRARAAFRHARMPGPPARGSRGIPKIVGMDHAEVLPGGGLRITLGLRAWGVNEERAQHWRKHRARTRAARDYTQLALADKALPGFVERVEIEAQSYGVRLDPGSDLPLVKAVVDALVDLGVLAGDASRHVSRLVLNAPISAGPERLVLVVRPAP